MNDLTSKKLQTRYNATLAALEKGLPKWCGLALISLLAAIESLVPVPIEVLVVSYILTHMNWKWKIALVSVLGCCVGAVVAYLSGGLLFEIIGATLLHHMGWDVAYTALLQEAQEANVWSWFTLVAVAPVPFPLVSLAAGAVQYPLPLFVLLVMLTRGLRYVFIAAALAIWGETIVIWIQQHFRRPATIMAAVNAIVFTVWGAIIISRNYHH